MRSRCWWAVITGFTLSLLLSACTTATGGRPTDEPTRRPATCRFADLPTCSFAGSRLLLHPLPRPGPRRPAGHQEAGRGVHRAGGPFDGALRRGSGQAQNRGRGGGRELPPSDGTGNSQFAIRNLYEALEARTDDRRIVAELLDVPVEKADSHLPHIASLTRRHVCTVE